MKTKLFSLLLTIVIVTGCGNHKKSDSRPSIMIGNIAVVLPNVSDEKQDLILEAAKIHIEQFEDDYGQTTRFGIAEVTTALRIGCGDLDGEFIGCCYINKAEIVITSGYKFELPALYHELWHLNIGDPNHEDSRWPSWDINGYQISERIRVDRPDVVFEDPPT